MTRTEQEAKIAEILSKKIAHPETSLALARQLWRGAVSGLEFDKANPRSFESWLKERVKSRLVWLGREDYARALVRALWLAPRFAATDFGGARQRDFAQVWTDTARGFLGEIAFQKFLGDRFGVKVRLDARRGALEEFLPSDVKVVDSAGRLRDAKTKISVKTTKFNGRWLDLPGAQFDHSDVFVLVKIGISRLHFSAFLKDISFLRDKLFAWAKDLGELNEEQANELWEETPDFTPIPAYIAGYVKKEGLAMPIHRIGCRKKGRKHERLAIAHGVGLFSLSNVRQHPEVKRIDPKGTLPVVVEPMIELSEAKHFLANSGALEWTEEAWRNLVKKL